MKSKRALAAFAAILSALLLFGCASGGSGASGSSKYLMGWELLVAVALAAVMLLLALGYMASVLLGDEKMKAWVKKEVGQAVISGLIAVILTGTLLFTLDSSLKTIIGESGQGDLHSNWQNYVYHGVCCDPISDSPCVKVQRNSCHVDLALDYLQILYGNIEKESNRDYWAYFSSSFFSNLNLGFQMRLRTSVLGINARPFAFLAMDADRHSILFDLAIKNMVLLKAQQYFMDYFVIGFLPLMLGIGLVLRILYFTRKLGGLLIALSLSIYYAFPLMYVLSEMVFFGMVGGWTSAAPLDMHNGLDYSTLKIPFADPNLKITAPTSDPDAPLFPAEPVSLDLCSNPPQSSLDSQDSLFDSFRKNWPAISNARWANDAVSEEAQTGFFRPDGQIGSLAMLMVFSLVTPFLSLMTVLASYKAFSQVLGGDVEISILSRLL